jgi:hypothetical protein
MRPTLTPAEMQAERDLVDRLLAVLVGSNVTMAQRALRNALQAIDDTADPHPTQMLRRAG